ncbi:SDR family NAD(P)-dependent oxidoreductase [Paramicrobacterium chengjingii]|uniref:SDR family NAD(P)-dependent oxidoreductase n=1 Tax=Paramicrobacterium chengjingii TaxID=2769067 RepID=UPI001421DE74|nr:SDR family NAD(P)-dependent oxidoreductase [Microbacterium chengjingii]
MSLRVERRTVVVTGANAGLGFWTTLRLVESGDRVVMACRSDERADAAAAAIRRRVPTAQLEFVRLDTADLGSVAEAAAQLNAMERIDVLIENAGIVHTPSTRRETVDGLELVAATNFFGHFALAAALLPALKRTPGSRIVTLGSQTVLWPWPRLDDPQSERFYNGLLAYARSKIMLQSFGFELDRRLAASGVLVRSLVAHPGYSISGRTPRVPAVNEPRRVKRFRDNLQAPFSQGKHRGALPIVCAASDSSPPVGHAFYGPKWMLKGDATRCTPASLTTNRTVAAAIWAEAERATGVAFSPEMHAMGRTPP